MQLNDNVIKQRGEKLEIVCPTCFQSQRKGLLWLGGKDYVECPDCGGPSSKHPGVFRMWEKMLAPPKVFAVNGLKPIISGFAHSPAAQIAVPNKIKE
jgi:DNA-directed RNA polymerase subunit RPC12/RpoP